MRVVGPLGFAMGQAALHCRPGRRIQGNRMRTVAEPGGPGTNVEVNDLEHLDLAA
ncbi:hypothetical protein [Streptomyces sp. NPDC020747]|uniref:hypothetical protein n=1 Tax=Streptomyces sp. NPDC020747 TaxID=3365086 RepID=UPI0037ABF628